MKEVDRHKVTKVKTPDGKVVYCAYTYKTDYRFSDLPGWAQTLSDSAFLIINPEVKDGRVVFPDYIKTVKEIRSELLWDSFYEMGRED